MNLLQTLFPNTMDKIPEFLESIAETLQMTAVSGIVSFALGLVLGIVLTVTKKGGILENKVIYSVLDKCINILRSVPFVILLTALMPFTRAIVGTAIGTKGAIIPLIVGTTPFFARQAEAAMAEVDPGLIEAAQSMGDGPGDLIFNIYLRESIPALTRGATITLISLIGLTAMAGAVGGGGIGNLAIMYGYNRYQTGVLFVTVVVLIVIVQLGQWIGDKIALAFTRK